MSSGRNWIGIKAVGHTRYRLAELISKASGCLVEAHEIQRTNPNTQHTDDCCAWDCWGVDGDGQKVHFYSWDRMGDCVRHGIKLLTDKPWLEGKQYDFEVSADEKA